MGNRTRSRLRSAKPQLAKVADSGPAKANLSASRAARVNDGLANALAGIGTSRDKSYYNEYLPVMRLPDQTLRNMFRGSWISRRIVTTVADDMTREWVTLTWDGFDDDIDTAKAIQRAESVYAVRRKVNTAIRMGRLFGGSAALLVMRGEDWSQPLDMSKIKQGDLLNIKIVDRSQLSPMGILDTDIESANHGFPLAYMLTNASVPVPNIHWSRVIRFAGQEIPDFDWMANGYWDDSVLQTCLDSITNYDAGRNGAASLLFESSVDILKVAGLTDLLSSDGGEAKVAARFQAAALMKSINRMMILNGGEGPNGMPADEYQQKTVSFAGVSEILNRFLIDLCGAADIPATRLFGQSPNGLNATGDSDTRNYYDHVASRQETNLRPQLAAIYEVLIRSTIGTLPDGFEFEFNPLWQMSDVEMATVQHVKAEADAIYVQQGILTEAAVARSLLDRGTYPTMTEDDVDLAEELAAELEAQEPGMARGALIRGGVQEVPATQDPVATATAPTGEPPAAPSKGGTVTPIGGRKAAGKDALGDTIKHEQDGWHVYAGDLHVGGPYRTALKASRRMRMLRWDRR